MVQSQITYSSLTSWHINTGDFMDIHTNIARYLGGNSTNEGLLPTGRYASFDYCYNYFQSFREKSSQAELLHPKYIQESCLQIGFYLASWGMFRGRSFLLQKSLKYYEPLINEIANAPAEMWDIDVDSYTDENIELLLECDVLINKGLGQGLTITNTLSTKVMLGVFGNIPAFDRYFRSGLGVNSLSKSTLRIIAAFYTKHKAAIDTYKIATIDYHTGEKTHRYYPKAKIVDMIGFIQGGEASNMKARKAPRNSR